MKITMNENDPKHVVSLDIEHHRSRMLLDGVDVSGWCIGFTVTQSESRAPEVTLTLVPDRLIVDGCSDVPVTVIRALTAECDAVPE